MTTATAATPNLVTRRIALLLPNLSGGGAERITLRLAEGLLASGAAVDLVTVSATGQFRDEIPTGVRLVDLGARRTSLALVPLCRYLLTERPTHVISALDHTNILAIAACLLTGRRRRLVVATHNTIHQHLAAARDIRGRLLLPLLMKLLYRLPPAIVTVSEGAAAALADFTGLGQDRITVIPNPVVSDRLLQDAQAPSGQPWLDRPELPTILAMGRLVPQKGFDQLLDSFAQLIRTTPARLIVFGEGPERSQLEATVRAQNLVGHVLLPGFTPAPYAALARASVFALSSRYEGLPTVLIEALALGTPVVAFDCPSGPREILTNAGTGMLVTNGDVQAFAEALRRTLETPRASAPRADLSRYSLAHASAEYARLVLRLEGACSP